MSRPTDYVTDCARHAGRVRRYHTWVVHHHQSVGEHCWQVALVYEQIFGLIPPDVERFIRHHDTAELVVGDPPFPVKAEDEGLKAGYDRLEPLALDRMDVPQLPRLSSSERAKVKICDLLEMMTHGMTEREMGNLLAAPIVLRTEAAAQARAEQAFRDKDIDSLDLIKMQTWVSEQWERHERVLRMASVHESYNGRGRRES